MGVKLLWGRGGSKRQTLNGGGIKTSLGTNKEIKGKIFHEPCITISSSLLFPSSEEEEEEECWGEGGVVKVW